MVVSIGTISSAAQGVSYFERDGYYTKDDPQHREVSAWAGKGAEALGLSGPVDADTFKDVLEGTVPDGSGRRLGRAGKDGSLVHRPGTGPDLLCALNPSPWSLCWAMMRPSQPPTTRR